MGIKSDIDDAIKVHGAWKAKFRDFLSGKAGMDMEAISHTDCCKLGMWLGEAGQRMLPPEDHAMTCELHEKFHHVAGDIVQNIKQKNFDVARQALASGGTFDQASRNLCAFLLKVSMHDGPRQEDNTAEIHADSGNEAKPALDSAGVTAAEAVKPASVETDP